MRRLVSGALTSLGTVATDVVTEIRQLTRGPSADGSDDGAGDRPRRASEGPRQRGPPRPVQPCGNHHIDVGSRMSNSLTLAPAPRSEAAEQVRAEVREFLAAELAAGTFETHVDTWLVRRRPGVLAASWASAAGWG